ncbi:MAG: TonB-dependent receptor [Bacteroidota bacterium]|nr:TonB-dependent receptor [Bacteroidota bacterium]
MNKIFLLFTGVCISFSQSSTNKTINDSSTVFQLNEVMVSATRSEKNLVDIGRSVDIIDNKQIKNFLYQSAGELLSLQSGVFVVGAAENPGMNQTIFMRGAASHQTSIMVDGVRLTDPSTVNNTADISEVSLLGSDRIEIVRGSHSTLFGSSTVGGVINILSKNNSTPGIHAQVNGTAGTFGSGTFLHSENLWLNYTDPVGFYLNGGIENYIVHGLDATVDTVTNKLAFKNRDKDNFDKKNYVGKIGYQNDVSDFYFSYKYNTQRADLDKAAFVDDENYVLRFNRNFFTYGASIKVDPSVELKYIGGYSNLKRSAVNDSSLVDALGNTDHTYFSDDYSGSSMTNELQGNFIFGAIDGVLGIGKYKETMNVKSYLYSWSSFGVYESKIDLDKLNLRSTLTNVFLHVNIGGSIINKSLEDLNLTFGGRLNKHDVYGKNATYEVNPSYKIFNGGLLYVLQSTGFTAPSLYQLFAPNTYYASTITRGNKNLQPEKSSSFEIGFKLSAGDGFRLSAAYFTTTVNNFIEYVYLWDGKIGIDTLGNDLNRDDYRGDTYLNVGKVTNSGFEITFNSSLSEQISLAGNFNFVAGKLQYGPADINTTQTANNHVQLFSNGAFLNKRIESSTLIRRPATANITGTYRPISELALRLDCRIVGERNDVYYDSKLGPYGALGNVSVASYLLVDFSQKYTFDGNISLSGRIENIFNKQYSDIKGFTTRGRSFYLNINYEI